MPLPTPRPGWSFCAWENTRCSFSGSLEVSYGANGTFTAPRTFTGGVGCNNTVFGDPKSGVRKWCETRPLATTTTASALVASSPIASGPVNTQAPTISGNAGLGNGLIGSRGTWTGSPTSFAYRWSRCDTNGASCVLIAGATGSIYYPVAADIGHTLRITVTASNAGGSALATSAPTATVKKVP
jgi:hypothetical protein